MKPGPIKRNAIREVLNSEDAEEGQTLTVSGRGFEWAGPVVYVQETEPADANEGDLWVDTSE